MRLRIFEFQSAVHIFSGSSTNFSVQHLHNFCSARQQITEPSHVYTNPFPTPPLLHYRSGHCKSLTPEYKKLGDLIARDPSLNSRVVIAKVNADDHRSIGERYQVSGFPTIKWFPRGRPTDSLDYTAGRTAEAMLEYIKKQIEYDNSFAVVKPLSEIAIKFTEGEIDATAALKEAKDAVTKLDDDVKDNAALYIKYLEKAGEKGKDYIETELARLMKMVKGGKMSTAKLVEVSKKISVLESFSKVELEEGLEGLVGDEMEGEDDDEMEGEDGDEMEGEDGYDEDAEY